jgi:hypothetical protein
MVWKYYVCLLISPPIMFLNKINLVRLLCICRLSVFIYACLYWGSLFSSAISAPFHITQVNNPFESNLYGFPSLLLILAILQRITSNAMTILMVYILLLILHRDVYFTRLNVKSVSIVLLQVETVAQFGVIFLLFALGLEFSTAKVFSP